MSDDFSSDQRNYSMAVQYLEDYVQHRITVERERIHLLEAELAHLKAAEVEVRRLQAELARLRTRDPERDQAVLTDLITRSNASLKDVMQGPWTDSEIQVGTIFWNSALAYARQEATVEGENG